MFELIERILTCVLLSAKTRLLYVHAQPLAGCCGWRCNNSYLIGRRHERRKINMVDQVYHFSGAAKI